METTIIISYQTFWSVIFEADCAVLNGSAIVTDLNNVPARPVIAFVDGIPRMTASKKPWVDLISSIVAPPRRP
jgi:hypothetical protein